jgi:hypothetical protein
MYTKISTTFCLPIALICVFALEQSRCFAQTFSPDVEQQIKNGTLTREEAKLLYKGSSDRDWDKECPMRWRGKVKVTRLRYELLSTGMRYSDVVDVVGYPSQISCADMLGTKTISATWLDEDYSSFGATFVNGRLKVKTYTILKK